MFDGQPMYGVFKTRAYTTRGRTTTNAGHVSLVGGSRSTIASPEIGNGCARPNCPCRSVSRTSSNRRDWPHNTAQAHGTARTDATPPSTQDQRPLSPRAHRAPTRPSTLADTAAPTRSTRVQQGNGQASRASLGKPRNLYSRPADRGRSPGRTPPRLRLSPERVQLLY